jgi:hypothetical protein
MQMVEGNSVASVFELKPPAKGRAAARPRNRGRKKQITAKSDVAAANAPGVIPLMTQSVTPAAHRLQLFRRSQAADRPSLLGAMLLLVTFAVAALGIGINAQTGWRFGTTPISAATFAGLSVAADVLAMTLPTVAVTLWLRSRWGLASAAWATWALSLGLAVLASIGFVNRHVGDAAAARQAVLGTAAALTAQRDAAITIARQAVAAAAESRQAECRIRGPRCRALEQEEQVRLSELSAALALPMPTAPRVADADPQLAGASRLATWAGLRFTTDDLGNLRLALMALLPNLAGLVLCFGSALRRDASPAIGTPPSTHVVAPQ